MLKRMRSFLVLVMLFITVTMSAQVTTATMSGKVTAQDEPIIGATIVAVHEPSGTRYGTVTNVSGQFNLQGMRTGGPSSCCRSKPLCRYTCIRGHSAVHPRLPPCEACPTVPPDWPDAPKRCYPHNG